MITRVLVSNTTNMSDPTCRMLWPSTSMCSSHGTCQFLIPTAFNMTYGTTSTTTNQTSISTHNITATNTSTSTSTSASICLCDTHWSSNIDYFPSDTRDDCNINSDVVTAWICIWWIIAGITCVVMMIKVIWGLVMHMCMCRMRCDTMPRNTIKSAMGCK